MKTMKYDSICTNMALLQTADKGFWSNSQFVQQHTEAKIIFFYFRILDL